MKLKVTPALQLPACLLNGMKSLFLMLQMSCRLQKSLRHSWHFLEESPPQPPLIKPRRPRGFFPTSFKEHNGTFWSSCVRFSAAWASCEAIQSTWKSLMSTHSVVLSPQMCRRTSASAFLWPWGTVGKLCSSIGESDREQHPSGIHSLSSSDSLSWEPPRLRAPCVCLYQPQPASDPRNPRTCLQDSLHISSQSSYSP